MIDWSGPSLLDRVEAQRADPDWLASLWNDPSTRLVGVGELSLTASPRGRLTTSIPGGDFDPQRHFLLGLVSGRAWFAEWRPAAEMLTLRSIVDLLSAAELEVAVCAVALARWHATTSYCSSCGAPTTAVAGGLSRQCTGCARELYPRTDPAVIVAILDPTDRLLLGRQPSWPPGRVSVFAGFVEIGESLEQAVHREMAEEVSVSLTSVQYLGSQPWPFPRSLMLGFLARTDQVDVAPAPGEIEFARWYSRGDLNEAVATEAVILPPPASIARRMIDAWLEGSLASS